MKVGIVLEQRLHSGGGFQQALNAIIQFINICPSWASINIYTTVAENVGHASLSNASVEYIRSGFLERITSLLLANEFLASAPLTAKMNLATRLENKMLAQGVDIVYFVGPSNYALSLRYLPYIFTVWDVCHRDHPEFPEVSSKGEFFRREGLYRNAINRSYLTLTDSDELKRKLCSLYGADERRLLTMPFQPAPFSNLFNGHDLKEIESRFNLPADYIFYPAQFWPHKNHVRILHALAILCSKGKCYSAVFCGGDQENKKVIQVLAESLGLSRQIVFTGFVSERDMCGLYALSKVLVMPTYFGPTNLPPLEAWLAGKPVVYSEPLKAQVGPAALCVDPDSAVELAAAIERIYSDADLVAELVLAGKKRLTEFDSVRSDSENKLLEALEIFNCRRACWGKV